MSGFEITGVVLGAIPLIISGLEHWREVAKVCGYYARIRKEHRKCLYDVRLYQILYMRNLEELLLPIVDNPDHVTLLVNDPDSHHWKSKTLESRLGDRLQESYPLYMEIINNMKEALEELQKILSLDNITVQAKLHPSERPQKQTSLLTSARTKWDYELFRIKFSFNEPKRTKVVDDLKEYNERLEKLLSTSDKITTLKQAASSVYTKSTSALEKVFAETRRKSGLLYKALQKAWQCSCQHHHFANLRLEHRTLPEICFEIILMFASSPSNGDKKTNQWSFKELQCGPMTDCSFSYTSSLLDAPSVLQTSQKASLALRAPIALRTLHQKKKDAFPSTAISVPRIEVNSLTGPSIKLCQRLGDHDCGQCMGIIGHESETYHLHPLAKRTSSGQSRALTLDHVLSGDFGGHLGRRQRYYIALLLASSVAQLQSTEWLRTGLTKGDIFFYVCGDEQCEVPFHEPFIRQGFPSSRNETTSSGYAKDYNFYSLGILLLELCFGRRLEDLPQRQRFPSGPQEAEQAYDLVVALEWSNGVGDEAGDDYASAIKWCFTGAKMASRSWQGDVIKHVVRPLEACHEHLRAVC
ncbi:uncharacterized protein F5Z01DRAFT_428781 [Emericellopsis atlantica]|uniref:DUF7580 domain-containing protein n=1 Tax=Emericellopsis atlantica TaxID=2614577 RepID=A0A9P8CKN0_9HYPO|nr:uncharacterized protein F5Z01DRAFT_428781 [Emericellopsis atlantica]KAG9250110.1 hypothetical protein F5Z01DRAFT_428781 [Emericellopsis atlantica]